MGIYTASTRATARVLSTLTLGAAGILQLSPALGAGPTATSFTPSGPITLSSGQVVSGLHITNPNGPCINGSNVTNVRITNNKIGPCGPTDTGVGINIYQSGGLQVDHNSFDDVASALYVIQGSNDIVFEQNYATRIRGPMPRGQMVQFNAVRGTGHKVMCNVSDQTTPAYKIGPEDHISMYASGGTPASPIDVAYNKIRGGGPSQTGGGMLAGDTGSDNITLRDNILIHPGQYGIAVAGGHNIRLLRNRVYSRTVFPWSNIGAYVWSQYGATCSGNEVRGNHTFFIGRNGVPNPYWNAGNCGPVAGESENTWDWGTTSTLSEAMWDEQIPACAESGTPATAPAAPTNLSATISRTTAPAEVNLSWTDTTTNEAGFVVERAPQGGTFTALKTVSANATSFVDTSSTGGTWMYRVKATAAGGDSTYSNPVAVSIAPAVLTTPTTTTAPTTTANTTPTTTATTTAPTTPSTTTTTATPTTTTTVSTATTSGSPTRGWRRLREWRWR